MTKLCEKCNGEKVLMREGLKVTCYVCKGVGRRKVYDRDLGIRSPRGVKTWS